jgi:hypothetical protein
MSAMSGSMPVVSQSIMKPMVPSAPAPSPGRCGSRTLANRKRLIPGVAGGVHHVGRDGYGVDLVDRGDASA